VTGSARVSHLRLVAIDHELVQRGAFLVEDALRVASVSARDDARLFIVRKLDLGTIDPDASSQTLALAIEQRVRMLELFAVPAGTPEAVAAPAVWFADEPTALAMLVARVVAGPPPSEWYWRQIAGGIVRLGSPAAIARACIATAASAAASPLAVALVVEAAEQLRPGALLDVIAPSEGPQLLALTFGASTQRPSRERVATSPHLLAILGPTWRARVATWVARTNGDPRAVWFAALALAIVRRAVLDPARAIAEASALVATFELELAASAPPDARCLAAAPVAREQHVHNAGPPPTNPPPTPARPVASAVRPATRVREKFVAEPITPTRDKLVAAPITPARDNIVVGERTTVGGLLFLVRPLVVLSMPAWLARTPWATDRRLPERVLADIALHCGAANDDPFVVLLLSPDDDPLAPEHEWAVVAWRRGLAGWLRRWLGTTLGHVVRRPGIVRATRVHIDIELPLSTVDLVTRAGGLDLNPGWVPWLGRVVAFYYHEAAT
jgi:hypothetical protein